MLPLIGSRNLSGSSYPGTPKENSISSPEDYSIFIFSLHTPLKESGAVFVCGRVGPGTTKLARPEKDYPATGYPVQF